LGIRGQIYFMNTPTYEGDIAKGLVYLVTNTVTFRVRLWGQCKARSAGNGRPFPRIAKLPLLLTPLTYVHVGHAALAL